MNGIRLFGSTGLAILCAAGLACGAFAAEDSYIIDVKAPPYNAVGDGVTNDTAAFQAAINAGRQIFVPYSAAGYKVGTLQITGPKLIEGQTKTNLIGTATIFDIRSSNVTIKGFNINMNAASTGTAAFYVNTGVASVEHINLEDCEVSNAYHMVLDANHATNISVNLHLKNLISWYGKGHQVYLRDAFAFLSLKDVTIDTARSTGVTINHRGISIANNQGCNLEDVHVLGNAIASTGGAGMGMVFENSEAIWIDRSMVDSTGGYGFWFDNCGYVYLADTVASLNTHGGMTIVGCDFVQGTNIAIGGRNQLSGLASANGIYVLNSTQVQFTNLNSRFNTGVGIAIQGTSNSIFTNCIAQNNTTANWWWTGLTNVLIPGLLGTSSNI